MAKLRNILIVDDSPNCIELLTLALNAAGASEVYSESEPREAVKRISSGAHDLVLLDLKMPGLSGLQVLEQVRGAAVKAPILMLSGSVRESDVNGAYERGCNGYFGKPDSLADYRELAKTLIDYWMRGDVPMQQ